MAKDGTLVLRLNSPAHTTHKIQTRPINYYPEDVAGVDVPAATSKAAKTAGQLKQMYRNAMSVGASDEKEAVKGFSVMRPPRPAAEARPPVPEVPRPVTEEKKR